MLMRKIVRLSRIELTEGFQFAGMFPIIATACVALIANDNLPKRVDVKYAFSDLNQTKKKKGANSTFIFMYLENRTFVLIGTAKIASKYKIVNDGVNTYNSIEMCFPQ